MKHSKIIFSKCEVLKIVAEAGLFAWNSINLSVTGNH